MEKIAIVYTSLGGLIQTMKKEFAQAMPGCSLVNIADDSLIQEVMEQGAVTEGVRERMMHYFRAAAQCKPKVIVSACSSVGEIAEEADRLLDIPVVRIDHAMIERAVQEGKRIGVLASLGTTMDPTVSYIRRLAAGWGREVQVIGKVAEGAYQANARGETAVHDALITQAAKEIQPEADVIILAQGSMARLEEELRGQTGLPVYSSPKLCAKEVKRMCEGNQGVAK